jgi:hypothetical protein
VSGRADSRDVSAIRALAARESRYEERTASLSHRIMRDAMIGVLKSANRRLTELAHQALRTKMWRSAGGHVTDAHSTAACAGPALGWGACSAAADSVPIAETERSRVRISSDDGG